MLVSFNWLKDYVDLPDSLAPEELALQLTMSTVEVEKVKKQGQFLEDVVVGEILEIKKHPGADKLSIAKVDVGEKTPRQIVFGQMVSMEVGYKVPVALAPTKLPGGVEIKKAKLRGEVSEGMLCLDQEMGLLSEGVSIRFFDSSIENGTKIIQALGLDDAVFDIDNKSMTHRPDLWGHYGLAREVAALYHKQLSEYDPPEIKQGKNLKLKVEIKDYKLCPRYMAVAMDNIKIGPSPDWMQRRLIATGIRPINNIVDITNYLMLDLAQPMHAFDTNLLEGSKKTKQIIVRRAENGEKFITLDKQERELDSEMLVIADSKKATALGGVMGGFNTEIKDNTTSVVFESANFSAVTIRKTSQKLGLHTEGSARWEKSLDPNNAELALKRAVQLTLEICPDAHVASNVVDVKDFHLFQGPIELSLETLAKKIGAEIKEKEVIKILERLGFGVRQKKNLLLVSIPTWRATKDISLPEDLVEEVARIYGYGNIPVSLPKFVIVPPVQDEQRLLEREIKNLLINQCNFTEVYNYSFISPHLLERLGLDPGEHVELDNPIAKDRPFLRRNLLPNILENAEKNTHYADTLKLFETGKVFIKEVPGQRAKENSDELLPRQDLILGMVYLSKGESVPFFELSNSIQFVLAEFGVVVDLESGPEPFLPFLHPGRQAKIKIKDTVIGVIGELNPKIQSDFGFNDRVAVLELNISQLTEYAGQKKNYHPLPLFPAIVRDLALVVQMRISHKQIVDMIGSADALIEKVELFDVYQGDKIGTGNKSLAFHLTFRSKQKTLESKEVDLVLDKLVKKLAKDFGAEVRK